MPLSDTGPFSYVISGLHKVYRPSGVVANRDISLRIGNGEIFGIFGPNGAGKTTLVKQMAALLRPTSGSITLFGNDVVANPHIVPHLIAYYGQNYAALWGHKVREVILHTAVLRGMPVAEARRAASELIERFGLTDIANRQLRHLSGGQRRQTALMAGFIGRRSLLILDEPTNELDPAKRRQVWDYLWEANQRDGTTIVLVTHNVLEAEQVVRRVAIIDRGRIIALGTPGELKAEVDDSVRIEVRLKEAVADGEAVIAAFPGAVRLREGHYSISAPRARAEELFREVIGGVGLDRLDDFRLITPTMEDVYVRYTRKAAEADGRDRAAVGPAVAGGGGR
jgi:ABC-2 type transport system ATP-binding protein